MRFLYWLGRAPDRWEIVEPAVKLRFVLGPEFFHRGDRLSGLAPTALEVASHYLGLFFELARSDPEHEAAARQQVQSGDLLGLQ